MGLNTEILIAGLSVDSFFEFDVLVSSIQFRNLIVVLVTEETTLTACPHAGPSQALRERQMIHRQQSKDNS